MGCSRDFCSMLRYARRADQCSIKNLKTNILSVEAKVLVTILENKECAIKEISILSGVSERHCYNAIENFISSGVIKKEKSKKDLRRRILKINYNYLCMNICINI